jgi:hypothetical protein
MHDGGGELPPDLEISATAAAASAAKGSKDSYTKTVRLPVVKNKIYRFWATYLHEDKETKKITESDRSPVFKTTFDIPNLTKPVKNLTLTAGSQSYGVKFDLDTESVQEDVVIFESLTSNFATQNIVYVGTSTNVTILTTGPNAFANRWVKVRSRDRWDDLNISEATAGPVKPFTADVDTTFTVENPGSSSAVASIDPKDLSGFSLVSTISWVQSTNVKTAGYAIRWSTDNPSTVTNPLWEYASVSGITTTSFTATGLIPNTTYYYQVASTTPYDVVNWTGAASGTFIASDADGTAAGALARLRSFIAIGGASQDLFKIGTGITQGINLSTDPIVSPTLTQGTYHGIVLNKSTTNVGNNFWLTTGQFRVGNPTEFMYWNGTNLYLTGSVNATGGKFTGNVQLAVPSGASTSGTLYAGLNPTSGPRVRFSSEGIFAYDSTSTSNETGQTFSLVQSTGRLNANLGTVGGWSLDTTGFSSTNTKIESNGTITLGDTTGTLGSIVRLSATDNFRLWIGSQSSSAARDNYFAVSKEGILYAKGAIISGNASFSGTLTVGTQLSDGTTIDSVKLNALKGITDADAAAAAALVAKNRGDQAYNEAIAAGQSATAASNAAAAAAAAAALKMAASDINTVLDLNTTVINGSRITTGQIDVARLNITGGSAGFNGFVVDGNGIRATNGGNQTLNISSTGTISLGDSTNGWTVDNQYIRSRSFFTTGYSRLVLDGWNGTIEGGRITASRFEANTITGGTITGSRIQTSTSGNRVELFDGTTDSLRVVYGSTVRGNVLATASSGIIMHAGATANANATTYGLFHATPTSVTMAADSANYLIATTSNVQMRGDQFSIDAGGNGVVFAASVGQDRGQVYFQRTTTTLGTLASTTTSGANAFLNSSNGLIARSTSSRRYKTNIESVDFTDNQLKSLRPVKFQGIADAERGDTAYRVGLIAEEVADIVGLEDIVEYNEDGTPENINYNSLAPILISVVKRILNRLDALEA